MTDAGAGRDVLRAPMMLRPHFAGRPWGGERLRTVLGKDAPAGVPIGESWEFSDHPHGPSTIVSGPFEGRLLGDVMRAHPRAMIGRDAAPARHPLLVKFLDAREDLSLQVHPDDAAARRLGTGDRGKSECWYVMEADAGAGIIAGTKAPCGTGDLQRAIADGQAESLLARHAAAPHSFVDVPAGTIHAILGGCLLCEIQQSSDTTFRLWDWGRQPARPLHVAESLEVAALVPHAGPARLPALGTQRDWMTLVENDFFRVRMIDVEGEATLPEGVVDSGQIIVVVEGSCRVGAEDGALVLPRGGAAFVPAVCGGRAVLQSEGELPRVLLIESLELGN